MRPNSPLLRLFDDNRWIQWACFGLYITVCALLAFTLGGDHSILDRTGLFFTLVLCLADVIYYLVVAPIQVIIFLVKLIVKER